MTFSEYFSPNYSTARQRFCEAGVANGGVLESIPFPVSQAGQRDLYVDAVVWGNSEPQQTLIISSGLHGAEGRFGSAAQLGWMDQFDFASGLAETRIVLLHALNPWGFQNDRRVDAENIDCNRNFLTEAESYSGCPELYPRLDGFLNPSTRQTVLDLFQLRAGLYLFKYGLGPLQKTIAAGQYDFPKGLFFGGSSRSSTFEVVVEHWEKWTGKARKIVHLDWHTGLGDFATGKLLFDTPLKKEEREWLNETFGEQALSMLAEKSDEEEGYVSTGSFGKWCRESYAAGDYLYCCAEFGTYDPVRMLQIMRDENRAWHWGKPGTPSFRKARQNLRDAFCPPDEQWQESVLATAVDWSNNAAKRIDHLVSS